MSAFPDAAGIYLLTHTATYRKYVGQSTCLRERIRQHSFGAGGGAIGRAVAEFGWDEFTAEVLETCATGDLNAAEQRWIAAHGSLAPNGFNTHSGGCRSGLGDGYIGEAPNERQARSRAARASTGGKQIAVMLTPAAAAKLAAWVASGESIASVVNRLLVRSRP